MNYTNVLERRGILFKKNTPLKIVLIVFITEIIVLIGLRMATPLEFGRNS